MFIDYYEVLNISSNATPREIKSAYRKESKEWHPDRNPNIDTTKQMQMVNEAYEILKDAKKKARYDAEYAIFKNSQSSKSSSTTAESEMYGSRDRYNRYTSSQSSYSYEYDIKDENVKDDIESARAYAKKCVDELIASLKKSAGVAGDGALSGIKPYAIWFIIMIFASVIVPLCVGPIYELENESSLDCSFDVKEVINIPNDWVTYEMGTVCKMSLPPTVELRNNFDEYTQLLKNNNLPIDEDVVVFQQYGLSHRDKESFNKYCRIMVQYIAGEADDFMASNETTLLDSEWGNMFSELVSSSIGPYSSLIGEIEYYWKDINGTKYIEIKYTRTGANFDTSTPVACRICIFQNSNEMVKVYLSYRDSEAHIWKEDFELIPKSFKWL